MIKILVSGASGFLGNICLSYFNELNYDFETVGIAKSDTIYCNLATSVPEFKQEYSWIIHLAGKAHITPKNKLESQEFFDINLNGTKNLVKGLEKLKSLPKSLVYISSVAVYGLESGNDISEDFPLSGTTPYALSKIQAERYLQDWCKKNDVILGILRPSLVAGENPPGNLAAMINGIRDGKYVRIGNGNARKSIVMANDIAKIIPRVAVNGGIYNLSDDYHPSFCELENLISKQLDKKPPFSIPYWIAAIFAKIGDLNGKLSPINSEKLYKITNTLTFSNKKAKKELNYVPLKVIDNFLID